MTSPYPESSANQNPVVADGSSDKTLLPAVLLCFFLGSLGIHRFYVGKTGTAIAMIFTLGGLGIWTLIDFIMLLVGKFTDSDGKLLTRWS